MQLPRSIVTLRRRASAAIAAAPYLRKWLILGALVGVVAGLGAVVFVDALGLATRLLLGGIGGYTPPSPLNEGGVTAAGYFARPWAIPLIVGGGGLVSGLLVSRFAPDAAGHGTDAAIAAVHRDPMSVRPRTSLVKIVASAITIGSGGSGGREGPTAQISAGFASFLARVLGLSAEDARIAVTIGIGSGIGAIFRTPLGGAVLGAEILYREDLETAAIVPGFVASILGFVVFGLFHGFAPIFGYHAGLRFDHPIELVYYAIIGLVAAPVALLYGRVFWAVHGRVKRSSIPGWLAPALGGLLVGMLALVFPQVLGTGYGWVQQMMSPKLLTFPLWLVILLPLAKILATSLSIGSGGSGGIFGPGMVIGALVGAGVWRVAELFAPGVPLSPAPFVIVGMMACFGSIGHIPIATMLMVAEMTGNLSLLAPAMVAVGLATLLVGDDHIYASQLKSRADSPAHRFRFGLTPLGATPITAALIQPRVVLRAEETAEAALLRLVAGGAESAPVIDGRGALLGLVSRGALEAAPGGRRLRTLAEVARPQLSTTATFDSAVEALALAGVTWAPVTGSDGKLAGVVTTRRLLARYTGLLARSTRRLEAVSAGDILLEARLADHSPVVGHTVGDISWPSDTLVLSVQHGEEVMFATSQTPLRTGDDVVIVTRSAHRAELADLLASEGDEQRADEVTPMV